MLRTPPTGGISKQKNCHGCHKLFQSHSNNHKFCTARCRDEKRSSLPSSQTTSQASTPNASQSKKDSNKRDNGHLSPHDQTDKRNKTDLQLASESLSIKSKEELIAMIGELNETVREQTERARRAEETMQQVLEDLNEAKRLFADEVISFKKRSYADAVRVQSQPETAAMPSLEARLLQPHAITRDLIDSILNSRENGPVAQSFSCKGDRVVLSFKNDEAMAQAKRVLQSAAKAKEVFKEINDRQRSFPLL
jgi:hypothetical protein